MAGRLNPDAFITRPVRRHRKKLRQRNRHDHTVFLILGRECQIETLLQLPFTFALSGWLIGWF